MAQGYARQDVIAPVLSPVYGEEPAGLIDGSNVTFNLAAAPYAGQAAVYWNGQRLPASEYSITGSTLTMTTAPTEGILICDYWT